MAENKSIINKTLDAAMRINLYKAEKHDYLKYNVTLLPEADFKDKYFKTAKAICSGTEDNFTGDQVEFFKKLRERKQLELPIMF